MQKLISDTLALSATAMIFSMVTVRHGVRRWGGLKSLFNPHINDVLHDKEFYIPADIQVKFKRIMFWRAMLKEPFLWEESAQKIHADMMNHALINNWKPVQSKKPDALEWIDINKNKESFYQNYIRKQVPCIIKNTPYDKKLWNIEHIRSIWGDHPMMVHDLANNMKSHEMTLKQMIDYNKQGLGCAYMSFNRTFLDVNRKLVSGTMCAEEIYRLLKKRKTRSGDLRIDPQLFISTESTHPTQKLAHTYMHCANNINMFYNIEGRKKWVLVDPEYSLCVYPSTHFRSAGAFLSLIKSPSESLKEMSRFPLYELCPKYEVDLDEGDILFVPCWWWHSVDTLTPATLSIALRFGPTVLGSLFPGDMKDPNTLFTTVQILYPQLKREVFDAVRTKIYSQRMHYDGRSLRNLDKRQELERDYDVSLTQSSEQAVRMWRKLAV